MFFENVYNNKNRIKIITNFKKTSFKSILIKSTFIKSILLGESNVPNHGVLKF